MLEQQNGIDIEVIQAKRFETTLKKLPLYQLKKVEDEIDLIISDPEIGKLKKGNLAYLRVHKFRIDTQEYLLGYSWIEEEIQIILLQLGSHENFG